MNKMNIKLIGALYLLCLLASCNSSTNKKKTGISDSDTMHRVSHSATFFDSVMDKEEIPLPQLQRHLLDTGYFSGRSQFRGDTVYYPDSAYPIVVLSMDFHGVCLEKYLLVYKKNSQKNAACIEVETDCDIDYGTNYDKLDYKVFYKNQFYTREAWYEVDGAKKVKITTTDQFYQVNAAGKIDSLKKKPGGLVLPKFIPMDVTDTD
jgi:hypothetical protein